MVPDFYEMLGVEPAADRTAVEAALARQQPIWSAGTRNPKTKHTYQSYLDQIPALRRTLLGEASARIAYDAQLAASRRALRDLALDELQRRIRLRAAKGGLTVSDRNLLRQEADRLGVPGDEFQRLIEPIPPRPDLPPDVDPPDPPLDVIEPAVRQQIRLALEHLRRRDLYHVLDLPRDASAGEIVARGDSERRKWMQKAHVTAEKTAWLEAISYAQSHLAAPEARARYDRTLALQAEEAFIEILGFGLTGLRQLDPGTRMVLLDEAGRLGIDPIRAERLLRRACRADGIVEVGSRNDAATTAPEPPRFLRCRGCGGVTTLDATTRRLGPIDCRHCGASLRWECPVCRRTHLVNEPRCACGFPLENLEPLRQYFDSAQNAFRSRDYGNALGWLERVIELAPQHSAARRAAEKVRQRIADLDRLEAAYRTEMARRSVNAAARIVDAWSRLADSAAPALVEAREAVRLALHEAATLTARADDQARTDPASARLLYLKALALVRDDKAAAEGLKRCPPDPPTALRATSRDGKVLLRWTAPAPDGVGKLTFRIIRKPDEVPRHLGDGIPVGEFSGIEGEDASVTPGDRVGYAVFAVRGSAASLAGAAAGPLVVLAEVDGVRVDAHGRKVRLEWNPPPGCVGVRVVRKEGGPPTGPEDGAVIAGAIDHAVDTAVEEGRIYQYAVFALFRGADERLHASRGIRVSALPHPRGEDVGALRITRDRAGLRLSWRGGTRGDVSIVRTARPVPFAPGTNLTRAESRAIDGRWLSPNGSDDVRDPDPPISGICYYTPVTGWGESMTIGTPTVYTCVADPVDLRARRLEGGRYHLRWRWMHQGGTCLIVARPGSFPAGPEAPGAVRVVVTEAEYGEHGYATLTVPEGTTGSWHAVVYGALPVEGSTVYSPGIEPSARTVLPGPTREVTVAYTLRPPRLPGRPWAITFRTEPPGQPVPATTLVGHTRTIPLSAEDGEVLKELPSSHDGETLRIRTKRNLGRYRMRVFLDPRNDLKSYGPIRLRHPEAGGTRV